MNPAELILYSLQVWMVIGAVIAAVFLTVGIERRLCVSTFACTGYFGYLAFGFMALVYN